MTIINYLWDEESYLEEYDENGAMTTTFTNESARFGNIISQRKNTTTRFYHYDVQGSTRQLTDENENVTDEFLYNAWGNEIARAGTSEVAFTYIGESGYYYDEETASFYIRARSYVSLIARWTSKDPIGFSGGMNLYQYVDANPVNNIDPSGLKVGKSSDLDPTFNCPPCFTAGPKPNYISKPNGCSTPPENMEQQGWGKDPNCPIGAANFLNVCNNHDKCYDTCLSFQKECDKVFLEEMLKACDAAVNNPASRCPGFTRDKCRKIAFKMKIGVNLKGAEHFDKAQANACICYPTCALV